MTRKTFGAVLALGVGGALLAVRRTARPQEVVGETIALELDSVTVNGVPPFTTTGYNGFVVTLMADGSGVLLTAVSDNGGQPFTVSYAPRQLQP